MFCWFLRDAETLLCVLFHFFCTAFLAPDVNSDPLVIVVFGTDLARSCVDSNPDPLMTSLEWFGPTGASITIFRVLHQMDVEDSDAGVYTCVLTAGDNRQRNASFTVVVQCECETETYIQVTY